MDARAPSGYRTALGNSDSGQSRSLCPHATRLGRLRGRPFRSGMASSVGSSTVEGCRLAPVLPMGCPFAGHTAYRALSISHHHGSRFDAGIAQLRVTGTGTWCVATFGARGLTRWRLQFESKSDHRTSHALCLGLT